MEGSCGKLTMLFLMRAKFRLCKATTCHGYNLPRGVVMLELAVMRNTLICFKGWTSAATRRRVQLLLLQCLRAWLENLAKSSCFVVWGVLFRWGLAFWARWPWAGYPLVCQTPLKQIAIRNELFPASCFWSVWEKATLSTMKGMCLRI